jgi:DnaK suppressor protein
MQMIVPCTIQGIGLTFVNRRRRMAAHDEVNKKDSPMDKQHSASFQQALLDMRTALLAQISAQRGGTVSRAEAAADHFGQPQDSRAQVATEREIDFALGERETAELAAIAAALARIEAGTYGLCTDCGVTIPAARLKVSPEAPRCILCQEQAEQSRAA